MFDTCFRVKALCLNINVVINSDRYNCDLIFGLIFLLFSNFIYCNNINIDGCSQISVRHRQIGSLPRLAG